MKGISTQDIELQIKLPAEPGRPPRQLTAEHRRLIEPFKGVVPPWRAWGPYVLERAWGTVREDYSPDGNAWNYLTHDKARSKAYRWGEDGIAGLCDRYQLLSFALALWNGRDPILKERMFGLSATEGNHGEDVKEYYFYLDSTPTHSYMKMLYKYPQEEFPYRWLVEENARRAGTGPEFELLDTGVFDEDRYFDVFVEYAKASPEDICIRIEAFNRGPEDADLQLLPHLWFRNTWAWTDAPGPEPSIRPGPGGDDFVSLCADEGPEKTLNNLKFDYRVGRRYLYGPAGADLLFTDNETHGAQGVRSRGFQPQALPERRFSSLHRAGRGLHQPRTDGHKVMPAVQAARARRRLSRLAHAPDPQRDAPAPG